MKGSFHLFRLFGIDVFLHWSWFLVAALEYQYAPFGQVTVHIAIYLTLFAIVLIHEFGHALACRSVGGLANRILLWPLGGIAFVQPPARPGAVLWSIAAGPLVNVLLVPITVLAWGLIVGTTPFEHATPLQQYVMAVTLINLFLLLFNLLPVYPLDGGQILQSLLWFIVGRVRSLRIAATIGIFAAVAGGLLALISQQWFLVAVAGFLVLQSWSGLQQARQLSRAGWERV